MILFKMLIAGQAVGLAIAVYGAVVVAKRCLAGRLSTADKIGVGFIASTVLSLTAVLFIL